jgi:hypothetical protein
VSRLSSSGGKETSRKEREADGAIKVILQCLVHDRPAWEPDQLRIINRQGTGWTTGLSGFNSR